MKNVAQWDTEAIEMLKELGLTEYDAKIYLTLVARSPLTATDISRESDVPMSKIYGVLDRLENGGWISVVPERPKQYRAIDPGVTIDNASKQAIDRLENSKSLLLKSLRETYDNRSDVEASEFLVVHGTVNTLNQVKEIVQSQKTGITVFMAFVNPRIVERINEVVKDADNPKQLFVIDEKEGLTKFAGLFSRLPYLKSILAPEKLFEGIIFVYTPETGLYCNAEGDDFKTALIIRDRGFLDLIMKFMEMSHPQVDTPRHDTPGTHAEKLAAHKAAAMGTFDKLLSKHKK